MTDQTFRLQVLKDTHANLVARDPVLADGEPALSTDIPAGKVGRVLVFGDGRTKYSELAQFEEGIAPDGGAALFIPDQAVFISTITNYDELADGTIVVAGGRAFERMTGDTTLTTIGLPGWRHLIPSQDADLHIYPTLTKFQDDIATFASSPDGTKVTAQGVTYTKATGSTEIVALPGWTYETPRRVIQTAGGDTTLGSLIGEPGANTPIVTLNDLLAEDFELHTNQKVRLKERRKLPDNAIGALKNDGDGNLTFGPVSGSIGAVEDVSSLPSVATTELGTSAWINDLEIGVALFETPIGNKWVQITPDGVLDAPQDVFVSLSGIATPIPIPHSAFTPVGSWESKEDALSIADQATGAITIPLAGVYAMDAHVLGDGGATTNLLMSIYVNGVERARNTQLAAPSATVLFGTLSVSHIAKFNAGDVVTLYVFHLALGVTLSIPAVTELNNFQLCRISD